MFSKFFSRLGTSQSRNNSYNTNESTKRVARSLGSLVLVFALVIGLVLSSYGASFAAGEFNIAFTSDMHDTPNNLSTWLDNVGVSQLDRMIFGGDYAVFLAIR